MENIKQTFLNPDTISGFSTKSINFDETLINEVKNCSLFDIVEDLKESKINKIFTNNDQYVNYLINNMATELLIIILEYKGIIIKDLTENYLNKHYGKLCEHLPINPKIIVYANNIEYIGEIYIERDIHKVKSNIIITPHGKGILIFKKGNKQRIGIIGTFENGFISGFGKVEYHLIDFDVTNRYRTITIPARKVSDIYEGNMEKMYPDGQGKYHVFQKNIINIKNLHNGYSIINKHYVKWYEFISDKTNYIEYLIDVFNYYVYALGNIFLKIGLNGYYDYPYNQNKLKYSYSDFIMYIGGFSNGKFHGKSSLYNNFTFNYNLNIYCNHVQQYETLNNITLVNKDNINVNTVNPGIISMTWNEGLLIEINYCNIYNHDISLIYTLIDNNLEELFNKNVIYYTFIKAYCGQIDNFKFSKMSTNFMIYLINVNENNEIYTTIEIWNPEHRLYDLFTMTSLENIYFDNTFNNFYDRYTLSFNKSSLKDGPGICWYTTPKNVRLNQYYKFAGNFKYNVRHGVGTLYRFDNTINEPSKKHIQYQGEWKHDVKDGKGYLRWRHIEIYGNFENNEAVYGIMKNNETHTIYIGNLSLFRNKEQPSCMWFYDPCKDGHGVLHSCIEQPITISMSNSESNRYNNYIETNTGRWIEDEKIISEEET